MDPEVETMTEPRDVSAAMRNWGVPSRVEVSLRELQRTPAVEWVLARWAPVATAVAPTTMGLLGTVGTGKTTAACAPLLGHWRVVHPWFRVPGDMPAQSRPRAALFVSMATVAALSLWDDEDQRLRQRALETELLILDDLGGERGDSASVLERILGTRDAEHRRTILTTNLDARAFANRYGLRVLDRMRADDAVFNALGSSLRGAK